MHAKDQTYLAKLGFADIDKRYSDHELGCRYLVQDEKVNKLSELLSWDDDAGLRKEIYKTGFPPYSLLMLTKGKPDIYCQFLQRTFGLTESELKNWFPTVEIERTVEQIRGTWRVVNTSLSHPPRRRDGGLIIGYYDVFMQFESQERLEERVRVMVDSQERREVVPLEALDLGTLKDVCRQLWAADTWERRTSELVRQFSCTGDFEHSLAIEVKARRLPITDVLQQLATYRAYDPTTEQMLATCYPLKDDEARILAAHGIRRIYLNSEALHESERRGIDQALEAF